ncbi:MAG: asparagine synthase (glutamine-hydrolyzing) [Clostridia bacterium]
MCGISGFSSFKQNYIANNNGYYIDTLQKMRLSIKHRGFDQAGEYLNEHIGFSHTRLSIRDISGGKQPMIKHFNGFDYAICYNGEIYNVDELNLQTEFDFETTCDTEAILFAYIKYGEECVKHLNGIFSFAIWDNAKKQLFLARDHLGVKPLFYTLIDDELIFASEIKALFANEKVKPILNLDSFREIFSVGPARTMGNGVFKNINELLAGHFAIFNENSFKVCKYWDLESKPHLDNYEQTVDKVSYLVTDSIKRQMVSDVPVCTFLSGGLDSSIITAVANDVMCEKGATLNTYSFDFEGNDTFFKSNAFQPERDTPYVDIMLKHISSNHSYLLCDESNLVNLLKSSMLSKDLPGMADVDASLLYFCEIVKSKNKVTLTGECADEIFGGYPWFYREDLVNTDGFPWSKDLTPRKMLLSDAFSKKLDIENYAYSRCQSTLQQVPTLDSDNKMEARLREITYLNIKWFMQTLLDRMDRASMNCGLEARVPFADHRIVDYVFNVPFSMKRRNNVEKSLLRDAFADKLPYELVYRKKSPYPKTYNPNFDKLLKARLADILSNKNSPLHMFIDTKKVNLFLQEPLNLAKPWFGQLMAGPQLIAYLIQINDWLLEYNPKIEL